MISWSYGVEAELVLPRQQDRIVFRFAAGFGGRNIAKPVKLITVCVHVLFEAVHLEVAIWRVTLPQ